MEDGPSCNATLVSSSEDSALALLLKFTAIAVTLIAGLLGVSLPLIGKRFKFINVEGTAFFVCRAFAAGVILATGFVHILPDGVEALQNPCLPRVWSSFPFAGFVAMFTALATLLVDNLCTEYYSDVHANEGIQGHVAKGAASSGTSGTEHEPLMGSRSELEVSRRRHSEIIVAVKNLSQHEQRGVCHREQLDERQIRNMVVLQILEVGVIVHSFLIGLSLGVSERPRGIKPLLAALCFHQFFEGLALGGSICQASFDITSVIVRSGFFAITTPVGIMVGIGVASTYHADTAGALIVEGLFDSASGGILIYIALVDLIATDFQSERLRGNIPLQLLSYMALFAGTIIMSSLAVWA